MSSPDYDKPIESKAVRIAAVAVLAPLVLLCGLALAGATLALVGTITRSDGDKSPPVGVGLALFGIALAFFLAFARFFYGAVSSLRGDETKGLLPPRLVPWAALGLGLAALGSVAMQHKGLLFYRLVLGLGLVAFAVKALLDENGATRSKQPAPALQPLTSGIVRAAVEAPPVAPPGPLPAVPFRVKIVDAAGCDAEMADGTPVKFGAMAPYGFAPKDGMECWVIDVFWLRGGLRARSMNLSGRVEDNAEGATKRLLAEAERQEEEYEALLAGFGAPRGSAGRDRRSVTAAHLLGLSADERRALASRLVPLRREGPKRYDEVFTQLVTVDPEAFHPHLADLSREGEPESLAFVRAPDAALGFAYAALEGNLTALALRDPPKPGSVATALEHERQDRAPANPLAASLLTLARAGTPRALAALERWLQTTAVPRDEVTGLFLQTGLLLEGNRLVRTYADLAFALVPAPDGPQRLYTPLTETCPTCGERLLRLVGEGRPDQRPLPLDTCGNCVAFEPYSVHVTSEGRAEPAAPPKPEHWLPRQAMPDPVQFAYQPAPPKLSRWPDGTNPEVARLGGTPNWVQYPDACTCPRCSAPMRFAAQFLDPKGGDGDDTWSRADAGLLYAFECLPCRVVTTAVQAC